MSRLNIFSRFCLALCFSAMIFIPLTNAFARQERGQSQRPHSEVQGSLSRHQNYRYHDGRSYRPVLFGLFEILIDVPPIGAIFSVLPAGHQTKVVGSTTYYYHNNVYYKDYPTGYLVVSEPVASPNVVFTTSTTTWIQKVPQETTTVNIPNSNGSYTCVNLVKQGYGYVGPQGEYYPNHPTVSQLRVLYGR